jgi:hypothetical protein
LQIATRELSVLPKTTAVFGAVHLAVESTYPWSSAAGAAVAEGSPMVSSAEHAAAATVKRERASPEDATGSPEHGYLGYASVNAETQQNR